MKKLLAIIISAVVLVSVVAVTASAYGKRQNADCRANGTGFVDTDGNGICDNKIASDKTSNTNFVDTDKDGVCDNKVSCPEFNGKNFTDADNDGICDNRSENAERRCGGRGLHCGKNR